jgi:2,5-dihydroxypyridine 5,6-dioxygenase
MKPSADLVPMFARELALCGLREGEVVAILTEPASYEPYVDAAAGAAAAAGASVFGISVPGLGWESPTPTPVRGIVASVPALAAESPRLEAIGAALRAADFVIDLIPDSILHVPLREELAAAGTRMLTVSERPEILERLFPTDQVRANARAVGARLRGAKALAVTSPAGTDLRYAFEDTPVAEQYGVADEPGRWDNWPSGLVSHYPADGSAQGTLVLAPGDALCHTRRYVESEVRMEISDGYIRSITGGLDAELISSYLKAWDEPEVFAVSHIAFGVHPNARWSALAHYGPHETQAMDARCYMGNFLFSTGPNRFTGRLVEAHLDMALRGTTVTVDGEPIVVAGELRLGEGPEAGDD